MFFKNFKKWETEFAGRKFSLETGKMAGLANAAFLARYGSALHGNGIREAQRGR